MTMTEEIDEATEIEGAPHLSTEKPADADVRVTLFTLDDQKFTIPKLPRANLALQYLDKVRDEGTDFATAWLLEEMLGSDAYEALLDFEYLKPEQLETIVELCQKQVVGKLDPNRAARRRRG